jgi:hypothetical protein
VAILAVAALVLAIIGGALALLLPERLNLAVVDVALAVTFLAAVQVFG